MRAWLVTLGFLLIIAAAPIPIAAQSTVDTLVAVDPGTRLELQNVHGDVAVRTWNRSAVRVVADVSSPRRVRIQRNGPVLEIDDERPRESDPIDYTLTVPAAMDLAIHGVDSDVSIEGAQGRVEVSSVKGDVRVRGGRTVVELSSVQGTVELAGASGTVEVQSVNSQVSVTDVSGDVTATTVNGSVRLSRVTSKSVEGTTVNGGISYDGTLSRDGWYRFTTHNGPIHLVVPQGTGATVQVSTFNGDLQASFPISITEAGRGKQIRFTLGTGGARIELDSFNGKIRLRRPGEP